MTSSSRLRLALVVPGLETGGGVPAVARFIARVARESTGIDLRLVSLVQSSKDPASLRLLSPLSWIRGASVERGEWEGQPYTRVGAVLGEFEFQRYRPRRVLTEVLTGSDVVQVVCGSPAWANAVSTAGVPVAVHVATRARLERRQRDSSPQSVTGWWRKAMTSVTDRMDDRGLVGAIAVQVMNPGMLDYVRTLTTGRNIDVQWLPPGVDLEEYRPLPDRKPLAAGYILCVGRLDDPRKRVDVLLSAYARLPEALRRDVRLVLAGSAAPPASFWREVAARGLRDRVQMIERPSLAALVNLYQRATVVVLPSDEEGFGMVIIEAMACGVPVVSTRSGGPDGIITDGEDGYLVPVNDSAALADRLTALIGDPALNLTLGRRARRTIEARYDARVVGDAFVQMWHRLASQRK